MSLSTKLQAAISYLTLHHPFLAVPLLRLSLVAKRDVKTAATNGRAIFYSPAFVEGLSLEQTIFLLAHEVLHVTLAHHLRRGDRNKKAWNAAADYVINLMLEEAGFSIIDGALLSNEFAGQSTERVYQVIMDRAEEQLAEQLSSPVQTGGGSIAEPTLDGCIPEGTGGSVEDLRADDGRDLSQAARSQAERELAVTLHQASTAAAALRVDGDLRKAFSRATEALPTDFDARAELSDLLSSVAAGREDFAWTRPNPRYLPSGIYLPSLSTSRSLVDPILAIDTSASITPRLLQFMAGFCEELLHAFPDTVLRIVYCDSEVRSTEEVTSQDLPVTLSQAQGGGLTRFQPVFQWVAENGYCPRFLLFLTDLLSPERPTDPGYPVTWLNVSPFRVKPPFGRRIDLSVLK